MQSRKPILIVGAGPAGLALARSLWMNGRHPFRIFDASLTRPDRGLGLWPRSQEALRIDPENEGTRKLRGLLFPEGNMAEKRLSTTFFIHYSA